MSNMSAEFDNIYFCKFPVTAHKTVKPLNALPLYHLNISISPFLMTIIFKPHLLNFLCKTAAVTAGIFHLIFCNQLPSHHWLCGIINF